MVSKMENGWGGSLLGLAEGNNNGRTMPETLVKARPVRAQIGMKNRGLPAGPIGIQAHETVALLSSMFQRAGSSAKEVLLFARSQDLVEVRADRDKAFSDEDGRAFERKAQSLPNLSPPSAAIVGYNLKGPSWLGQRIGGMKPSIMTGLLRREEDAAVRKGKTSKVQTRGSTQKEEKVVSKKLWTTLFPPSFDRRQGLRSRNEPLLLGKSSSVSEECLMEEDFRAGSQMERGFRASPLFHCRSTRNRKRCSGEGASSSRGEAVLRNPHFEKDKEGLLSRVGLYLYGSFVTDLPYNLEIRGKGLNFKGNCEMLVVENWRYACLLLLSHSSLLLPLLVV